MESDADNQPQEGETYNEPAAEEQNADDQSTNPENQIEQVQKVTHIFVANLPLTYTEEDCRNFLNKFARVEELYLVPDFNTRKFKGQVKITFSGVDDRDKLIQDMRATKIDDVELRVEVAHTKEQQRQLKERFMRESYMQSGGRSYDRRPYDDRRYDDRMYGDRMPRRDVDDRRSRSYYNDYYGRDGYRDRRDDYYGRRDDRRDDYYGRRDDRRDGYSDSYRRDDYGRDSRRDSDRYGRRDDDRDYDRRRDDRY